MPVEESLPRDAQTGAEDNNSPRLARDEIDDDGGEFGLAIVGDLGFGVHMHSVTLWGLGGGHHGDGLYGNNIDGLDSTSEVGSRP